MEEIGLSPLFLNLCWISSYLSGGLNSCLYWAILSENWSFCLYLWSMLPESLLNLQTSGDVWALYNVWLSYLAAWNGSIESEFMVWSLNPDAKGSYASLVGLHVDNYQVTMKKLHPDPRAQYAGIKLVSNGFNHPQYFSSCYHCRTQHKKLHTFHSNTMKYELLGFSSITNAATLYQRNSGTLQR